jgi:protoporphyrinogen oxidase
MRVGVIGGGVMGLTLAYRLTRAGHRVTVLEAGPQVGGLATWFDYGDFIWDKYYHVILPSDTELIGLLDELGLASRLTWTETKTGFLWRGRFLSMSNYWEFLTFPALSLPQKARLAAGLLRCRFADDSNGLQGVSAVDWLTKVFGAGVYRAIWEPLLESKYGSLTPDVPASIMWATIQRYQDTRSNGQGKERMGYLRGGGLRVLLDALYEEIREAGGEIRCGIKVSGIDDTDAHCVRVATQEEDYAFDRVVSSLPTETLRGICPHRRDLLGPADKRPETLGVICAALVLKRPLTPFYVTNLIDRDLPFTGIIELSNLIGEEERSGHSLVMLPRYDLPNSSWFTRPDEEIASEFIAALRTIWPDIDDGIRHHYVNRERVVQALWIDGAPVVAEPRRTRDGRIWSINNELAGQDTLNNNAVVCVATESIASMLGSRVWSSETARARVSRGMTPDTARETAH